MINSTLQLFADHFYEHLKIKNYSINTIISRKKHIRSFILWCNERGIQDPSEVSRAIIEAYQKYLFYYITRVNKRLSASGQRLQLTSVKMYFKFLSRKRYITTNPAIDIEMPKTEKRLPKTILTVDEVELIFDQIDITTTIGIRDRTILEVLYSTGIRRTELANLELFDVNFEKEILFINEGKGKKDRIIPIGTRALKWLRKYIDEIRPQYLTGLESQKIFLSRFGDGMTPDHFSHLVRDYIIKADIGKEGSCHMFRHTVASIMHENGADIRFVQQMLGHESISTTQIYTQVNIKKLQEVYRTTHPAEQDEEI